MANMQSSTSAELLWKLLLAQIVYDEAANSDVSPDFMQVARVYQNHPLLSSTSPNLTSAREAQRCFNDLLKEHKVSRDESIKTQAAQLAEPLYIEFHSTLSQQMEEDSTKFQNLYRAYELQENVPKDERLKESDQ